MSYFIIYVYIYSYTAYIYMHIYTTYTINYKLVEKIYYRQLDIVKKNKFILIPSYVEYYKIGKKSQEVALVI